jgi:hypothetical protein
MVKVSRRDDGMSGQWFPTMEWQVAQRGTTEQWVGTGGDIYIHPKQHVWVFGSSVATHKLAGQFYDMPGSDI